jgi:hypothetical protein
MAQSRRFEKSNLRHNCDMVKIRLRRCRFYLGGKDMPSNASLSRRDFMRLTVLAAGSGLLLTACGRSLSPSGDAGDDRPENYYRRNKNEILKEIKQILAFVQAAAANLLGEAEATQLVAEAMSEFERLLPDLPYIGGDQNDLTANLSQSAAALAFYHAMLAHGQTVEQTGEILYRAVESQAAVPLMGLGGRFATSDMAQQKLEQVAKLSHERQYPGDWVFDFVHGDGETFDYGIDYLECGICKYLQAQQASELTPYLCLLDFPMSQAMNTGLVRTATLAHGAQRCDFRYKMGRPCQREWMPDFLKGE